MTALNAAPRSKPAAAQWLVLGALAAAVATAAVLIVLALAIAIWPDIALFKPLDSYARAALFTIIPAFAATGLLAWLAARRADPVRALREMRRVCRPDGVVAVRDGDYAAMSWWPASPGLDRWQDLYRAVARANGGEPDAARRLVGWVRAAGFDRLEVGASAWCFADPADRAWWSETWAVRIADSPLADRALELGLATRHELDGCAAAWRAWALEGDACFVVPHAEVLAWP